MRTFAFPQTRARYYRLELQGAPLGPAETMSQVPAKAAAEYVLAETILHSEAYIHRWEEKAGYRHLFEYESVPTLAVPADAAIQREDLIDLTAKMETGNLQWNVPAGDWQILRMGFSLTGAKNRPAMPTGLGFEVDKLSRDHTEAYIRDYMRQIAEVLATALWGDLDGISRTRRTSGKGQVVWGLPLADVLASLQIAKDVEHSRLLDMDLYWIHRRTATADIYFVVNGSDRAGDIDVRFRVTGKTPELWFPDTGERRQAAYQSADSLTTVPLTLPPYGSILVVFQQRAADTEPLRQDEIVTTREILAGPWDVSFPANSGAPEKIRLEQLHSWTAHADVGVQYFSGTAVYVKTITAPAEWLRKESHVILDLGEVRDIARVFVNGQAAVPTWKPPYLIDITHLLKPGANDCRIEVTNQWTNRLLGDHDPHVQHKVLAGSAAIRFFGAPPPLQESGLLGPVTLISKQTN
ncbi:hypothetical protein JW998_04590 [candidate division KSB1 bacterium]|nr:hypothetical protein [candidate division KSB1 bacterium]